MSKKIAIAEVHCKCGQIIRLLITKENLVNLKELRKKGGIMRFYKVIMEK